MDSEITYLKREDLDRWLNGTVQSQTNYINLILEKISCLTLNQKLFVIINIANAHFTLLAIMRDDENSLLSVYIDSFGNYNKTFDIVNKLINEYLMPIKPTALTQNYQFNNDCAIQVYEAIKILTNADKNQFNANWLWSEVERLELFKKEVSTTKRLDFAKEYLKEVEHFSNIYNEVIIDQNLENHFVLAPSRNEKIHSKPKISDNVNNPESETKKIFNINRYSHFKSTALNNDSSISLIFSDIGSVEEIENKLFEFDPSKKVLLQQTSNKEFVVQLTPDEYNQLMGGNAYEEFVTKYII